MKTLLKKINDWNLRRKIKKARRIVATTEKAFANASFDFLTLRGWVPTPDKPGYWTRVKNGDTTIVCSFREALQRTLM